MPDPRPPFNLLQAVFWLVAIIVCIMMSGVMLTVIGCILGVWTGRLPIGTCRDLGLISIFRTIFQDALTAVLALLAIRQPPPPPSPPEENDGTHVR